MTAKATESTEFVEAELFNICVEGLSASSYVTQMIYIPSMGMAIHSDGRISVRDPRYPDLRYYAHEAYEAYEAYKASEKADKMTRSRETFDHEKYKQMMADEHKKHCKIIMVPLNVVKQLEDLDKKKQKLQNEMDVIGQGMKQLGQSIISSNVNTSN